MQCYHCKYKRQCDGADCYYDYLKDQREAQSDYDVPAYYMVDDCSKMAFSDTAFSKRDIDDYNDENPFDDMHSFLTKTEIESNPDIRWDNDDYWRTKGTEDAQHIIAKLGLQTIFNTWKDYDKNQLTLKRDIGFYDEIMRQAAAAGLM